ncbi:MAG: sugar phosphate nucleotidyltransferase [bacterium]
MENLAVVILAAGKGTRMKSDLPDRQAGLPKVFHEILGEPMLTHVLETVKKLNPEKTILVVGHQRALLMDYYQKWPVEFAVQDPQLGTGHAVMQAKPFLDDFEGTVLVLAGDVPLIKEQTLLDLLKLHAEKKAAATDLTAILEEAGNYGRIVRSKDGSIERIVEKRDASPEELKIKEINTGTFCFEKRALFEALAEVKAENAQQEYYLTDTLEILKRKGSSIHAYVAPDPLEIEGINTKEQLVNVEKILLSRRA